MIRSLLRLLPLLLLTGAAVAGPKQVRLSSWDALGLPGKPVTVSAKLEKRGIFRKDLDAKPLKFFHLDPATGAETLLGEAVTDDEGEASVSWTPPGRGEHRIEVRFPGDRRYAPGKNVSLISVRDPSRPVAIFDIDHTLQQTSVIAVAKGKTDDLPVPGAPEAVAALSEHFDVVYISARMTRYLFTTQEWLDRWGFPRNPVYLLDKRDYPEYDEAQYKIDTMNRIRESYPNLVFGVGDKETDAVAYTTVGIRAFILKETGGVPGAEKVSGWPEVVRKMLGDRAERFGRLHGAED